MALSANKERKVKYTQDTRNKSFYLASAAELFAGALVGIDTSGYAKEASKTIRAVGVAQHYVKNDSATAVDTTQTITVEYGQIERIPKTTAAASMIGKTVYAIADDAVSTAGSALHALGVVENVSSSTYVDVRLTTLGK